MKGISVNRVAIGILALVGGLMVAGCPLDTSLLPALDEVAGLYWVEYTDGALEAYELPRYRGEAGQWLTLETGEPAWYTGPALYEVTAEGQWERLAGSEGLTLDEVLQTYDPRPAPAGE